MRAEIIEPIPGEVVLRLTHCRSNDRMQHMGHPLEGADDNSEASEVSADDDEDDEDKEEEKESDLSDSVSQSEAEEGQDDEAPGLDVPAVTANAVFLLQSRYPNFVSVKAVEQCMKNAMSKEDVLQLLLSLYHDGFVDVQTGKRQ